MDNRHLHGEFCFSQANFHPRWRSKVPSFFLRFSAQQFSFTSGGSNTSRTWSSLISERVELELWWQRLICCRKVDFLNMFHRLIWPRRLRCMPPCTWSWIRIHPTFIASLGCWPTNCRMLFSRTSGTRRLSLIIQKTEKLSFHSYSK